MPTHADLLVVEDNPDDVLLLKCALEDAGIQSRVRVARDGEDAIRYLSATIGDQNRTEHPPPTVVFLDLNLPRKSGLEVLRWIKTQPALKDLIVVVVTSSNDDAEFKRCCGLGVNAYLKKPITPEQLLGPGRSLFKVLTRNVTSLDRELSSIE
jgi:CheY-like chemotaxis protein